MLTITPDELRALRPSIDVTTAAAAIRSAIGRAVSIAPCLVTLTDEDRLEAARSIVLDALVRRIDGGSGVVTQQTAGPFGQSIGATSLANLFTAQERADLRGLCGSAGRARTISTAPEVARDDCYRARINGQLGAGPGGL